ncbi:MAG TPA: ATP-binding protein [Steroidobacteraceae bacterium]|jgi:signal transduction histidine kinase/CheY-like chemotaxis protein|nr:ATP-binding protein [Steroidobacteraceae bacterium]
MLDHAGAQAADPTRFKRLRLRIALLGVLVVVAFAGASAYDAWRSRESTISATHREITNVAAALAEQTAWTFEGVDLLLRDTARWYQNDGAKIAPERLDEILANRSSGVRQIRIITITDAHGVQIHRSRGAVPPHLDVSDRSYFIAQRDRTVTGLFMSEPLITRSEGHAGIVLSRRLEDETGAFAGVVTAIVNLEDLEKFFAAVSLGRGTAVQLLRDNGQLLVRNPPDPDAIGKSFPRLAASGAAAGPLTNPIDGRREFVAAARVRDVPLLLVVSREQAVVLGPWHDEAMRLAARSVVVALLGLLGTGLLWRQLRRIEASEGALRASEERLRLSQKMEAMGTLAGGIAHDFNNILGAILGYGELAQEQAAPGTPLRRYLDNVMHAADRARALVDRILGFSRRGLGERAHVHIQSVVEETLELIAASLPANIRMEKALLAGDAALIGDSTQLHQVAMNLCANAVHAMEHGGTLGVVLQRVDLAEARTMSRGALSAGPYVRLVLSDTGVGIPPDVIERMFDPFFTTRGVGKGTGLGLSLVHGIVSDLGGAIDVQSKVGEGTAFAIWLPITTEAAGKPAAEPVRELTRGRGETLMIVDDEPALVALSEEMLAGLGYEPVGFESSRAALQAFRAAPERFDLVLADEAMPELVGTELAREIRLLKANVPIILMSGHGGAPLAQRAAAIGVKEVLHKPLQRAEIAEALARAFGR